jgi:DNA-binding LacI/PurR family transcriptional regulator
MGKAAGASAASIKDVARESGVSYKTVSRVINGEPGFSAATRTRVETAIAALGYTPHHGARSLRRGRTRTLRLVMHRRGGRFLANPFADEVVAGVADTASRLGYGVLLELVGDEDEAPFGLGERRADATVLLDSRLPRPRLIPALVEAGLPCVVLANGPVDPAVGWIDADFEGGGERMVRHLLDLGHRRIGHLADDPALRSSLGRRAGYEAALRAAGIVPEPDLVEMAGQMREDGDAAAGRLLARCPDLTALYCVNDLTAFGAIDCLRRAGRRVPEDVSITGYDDILLAAHAAPPLTTVRLPWYEMAAAAVEAAVGAIDGDDGFPTGVTFPVELCLRGSTAPAPA